MRLPHRECRSGLRRGLAVNLVETSPIAIPATGARSAHRHLAGTGSMRRPNPWRSSRWSPEPQKPDGLRRGTLRGRGSTGVIARSASAPWPISRRLGEPTRPVSPVSTAGSCSGGCSAWTSPGQGVQLLLHLEHVQSGDTHNLGFAALEER